MTTNKHDVLEVLVGNSYGPRDADLADAARQIGRASCRERV